LYQRALAIYEQHFSPDHPEVADTLTDLAVLHLEQVSLRQMYNFYRFIVHSEDFCGNWTSAFLVTTGISEQQGILANAVSLAVTRLRGEVTQAVSATVETIGHVRDS
jgi:hypothetical protein